MGVRGQLSVPSVVLGAEMAGASLYGSFRAGVTFGSGDASAADLGSRWGILGSNEVSEGLTASYKYEGTINTNSAESFGGAGHGHSVFVDLGNARSGDSLFSSTAEVDDEDDATEEGFISACSRGIPFEIKRENAKDPTEVTGYELLETKTEEQVTGCGERNLW